MASWRALACIGLLLPGCSLPGTPAFAPIFSIQAETVQAVETTWNLSQIGAFPPVRALEGAARVVTAIIDTGVDPSHPELKDILLPMIDLVGSDSYRGIDFRGKDGNGHGTHVAGIVRETVGPHNPIRILSVKAIGQTGIGDDSTIAAGIRRAVDWRDSTGSRVRVLNLSIGGKTSSWVLEDALKYAVEQDVLVVVAAGNRERDVDYPAALPTALAVSATTAQDGLASYSNRGLSVGIAAPGGDSEAPVVSSWPTYLTSSDLAKGVSTPHERGGMVGTSMAAPHVTGAAALLFAQDPSLTALQVRTRLQTWSADLGPVGPDGYFGVGRLMVDAALSKGAHDAH